VDDVSYFSLLRPLYEVEIAERFSTHTKYHKVFRSCNRGKKDNAWCGQCSKCLFVNIILGPFMTRQALFDIFGSHLLENKSLEPVLLELMGLTDAKPFECVGTVDEVRWSMKKIVERYRDQGMALPYLAKRFMEKVPMTSIGELEADQVEDAIPELYKGLVS